MTTDRTYADDDAAGDVDWEFNNLPENDEVVQKWEPGDLAVNDGPEVVSVFYNPTITSLMVNLGSSVIQDDDALGEQWVFDAHHESSDADGEAHTVHVEDGTAAGIEPRDDATDYEAGIYDAIEALDGVVIEAQE
jgi:hypothetical protein